MKSINLLLIILSLFTGMFFLVFLEKLSIIVPSFYFFASLTTFVLYAKDKSAAKQRAWRTPESTLHFMALIGGWPGALLGQNIFRHKSKKLSFKMILWLIILLNCITFIYLFFP